MNFKIQTLTPTDYQIADQIIYDAFVNSELGYNDEVKITQNIRDLKSFDSQFQLGAFTEDNQLVGVGLLSESQIIDKDYTFDGLLLAPLAVSPEFQSQGIGKQIISELENRARKINVPYIHLVGHPEYYKPLGYQEIKNWDLKSTMTDAPDDVLLIKELIPNSLDDVHGTITYNKAFS